MGDGDNKELELTTLQVNSLPSLDDHEKKGSSEPLSVILINSFASLALIFTAFYFIARGTLKIKL